MYSVLLCRLTTAFMSDNRGICLMTRSAAHPSFLPIFVMLCRDAPSRQFAPLGGFTIRHRGFLFMAQTFLGYWAWQSSGIPRIPSNQNPHTSAPRCRSWRGTYAVLLGGDGGGRGLGGAQAAWGGLFYYFLSDFT